MSKSQNILVVIGHPSKKSLSHKLAHAYADGAKEAGKSVKVLDVYDLKKELPLVDYQDFPDWARDKDVREHYQAMITEADKLVFFHPIWWGGLPPKLKNFIDQTLTPGFAYKFGPRKFVPQALNILPTGYLKDKKAHVFITYDAYTAVYLLVFFPFVVTWAVFVFFYCGITKMRFTLHGRVRYASETKRSKWHERARTLGSKA
jgi:NAD(P)H dehydrogenase (quinone)